MKESVTLLHQALQIGETTGERWFAAELDRQRGPLVVRQGHPEAAEELYRQAPGIAGEQEPSCGSYAPPRALPDCGVARVVAPPGIDLLGAGDRRLQHLLGADLTLGDQPGKPDGVVLAVFVEPLLQRTPLNSHGDDYSGSDFGAGYS
ncbi:MAG: hypothetical protein JO358_08575 [Alphaproteobacteria bacterium]|nr:hypothetical protein [Alphaproteobacteria bacterium]